MNMIKSVSCTIALAAVSQIAAAAPFAFEARSLGMGNIGVATADIATAPFANPAMLAYQRKSDDFSLLLALGGYLNDSDGLIKDIDDFQAADAAGDDATMLAIAQQLNNKVIVPELSAALAAGFAGDTWSMAVSARADIIAVGGISDTATNIADVVDPDFNILNISGVQTTELGFSLARNFELMGRKVSVGLTPKQVSVEAVSLSESILTVDTGLGDLIDDSVRDLGSFTTLDAGIAIGITDNLQFGLVAKNLITDEASFIPASTSTTPPAPVTIEFDTQLRAGLAYRSNFLTIGADLDLIENEPIAGIGAKSQMLSLGTEFNVSDFIQLRVGAIKNIASGISSSAKKAVYTAGAGIWLGFNLDLAVVSGEGESLGFFAQTGFRF